LASGVLNEVVEATEPEISDLQTALVSIFVAVGSQNHLLCDQFDNMWHVNYKAFIEHQELNMHLIQASKAFVR
jgi:hypothetical protein